MSSVVDICNLALSHIGDTANVTSIDPPDGSAQAGYCATFYPPALGAALEMASWGFATLRVTLAPVDNPSTTWRQAYAYPADVVKLLSVLPECALDDYTANFGESRRWREWDAPGPDFANPAENMYMPQLYSVETNAKGELIILTNVCNAVLRYTNEALDPNKFSPLFLLALSYLLASMLAGPIIKGDAGTAKSADMLKAFEGIVAQATMSDANQRHIELRQRVPWMAGR